MTRMPIASSMFFPCVGDSSSSKMTSVVSVGGNAIAQLVDLALPQVRRGVRAIELLRQRAHDLGAGSVRQPLQLEQVLVHVMPGIRPLQRRAHKQCALNWRRKVDYVSGYGRVDWGD